MIIANIFEAFYSRYANDTPLPAYLEGLYFARAPQDAEGSYAVFSLVSGRQEYDMSSRLEDMVIQVTIFTPDSVDAEGPTLALAIAEEWMLWFDDCDLSVAVGTLVRIDRQAYNVLPDPDGPGWMATIDYALLVQED
jgi:hypothetical protein